MDLNSVFLVGRLTRDVEVCYLNNGQAVATMSIANGKSYVKDGQKVDETYYFDVTLWGKIAETLKPYLTKGKQIAVTGRLKQDRWEKDGVKNSKVSIVAQDVQLLGGRSEVAQETTTPPQVTVAEQVFGTQNDTQGDFPEDVPF